MYAQVNGRLTDRGMSLSSRLPPYLLREEEEALSG